MKVFVSLILLMPLTDQVKILKDLANDPQKSTDTSTKLYSLCLSQNTDALYTLSTNEMKESGISQEKFLDERNVRWLRKIEGAIADTPTFIAVGAAHLGGKKGLVNLLREKGYILKPIRL